MNSTPAGAPDEEQRYDADMLVETMSRLPEVKPRISVGVPGQSKLLQDDASIVTPFLAGPSRRELQRRLFEGELLDKTEAPVDEDGDIIGLDPEAFTQAIAGKMRENEMDVKSAMLECQRKYGDEVTSIIYNGRIRVIHLVNFGGDASAIKKVVTSAQDDMERRGGISYSYVLGRAGGAGAEISLSAQHRYAVNIGERAVSL